MTDARIEEYEAVELFGHSALFTNDRIDRSTVPEGCFCYDIRYSDEDDAIPAALEPAVRVNHMGTILCKTDFGLQGKCYIIMDENSLNFLGDALDLDGYLAVWTPGNEPKAQTPAVIFDEPMEMTI